MGQKLTDNNPNVADLSDLNRPTKLGERYTELYDNQWTDAFDVLATNTNFDEMQIIFQLKSMLRVSTLEDIYVCQCGTDCTIVINCSMKIRNAFMMNTTLRSLTNAYIRCV